jgi:hypothetical protein
MALEDYLDSEVGIAVAATAVLLSPRMRGLVRKGIVSVLAGAIKAGGVVARGTRNMQEEAKHVTRFGAAPEETTGDAEDETNTTSRARQQRTDS